MFWRATENIDNFDRIWAVAGPILGVAVGAIPALFFAQGARRDQRDASRRAEAYASVLPEARMPAALDIIERTSDIEHK